MTEEARARMEEGSKKGVKAAQEVCSVFATAEEFIEAADKYFDECDAEDKLYSESGLCLGLTKYNSKGKNVTLRTLQSWYDGERCEYLKEAVQMTYLRIQEQIETDPRYMEKGGMTTKAIFLMKQKRLGARQDKLETKQDTVVHILHGDNVDASDFA